MCSKHKTDSSLKFSPKPQMTDFLEDTVAVLSRSRMQVEEGSHVKERSREEVKGDVHREMLSKHLFEH